MTGKRLPRPTRRQFLRSLPGIACLNEFAAETAALSAPESFDVCVAGTGPAGMILACRLVEGGMSTVLLEGGHDGYRLASAEGQPETNTFDLSAERPSYPIERTRFQGPGGTSNLWDGGCARLQPVDFTPANSYADTPWPIRYAEIERHYEAAEHELLVCGGASTRYSPPRSAPYSRPPFQPSAVQKLIDTLGQAGVAAEYNPLSSSHGEEGLRVARSHLPRFRASSRATYLPGHKVTRVVMGTGGQVDYLEVMAAGQRKPVRAACYVLATGGIESPRLLLLSRSPRFPRGIGNDHGLVGRYFTEHLAVDLGAARLGRPWTSAAAGAISWQFYEEFKAMGLAGVVLEFGVERPSLIRVSAVLEMKPAASNHVWLDERRKDGYGLPPAAVSLAISVAERRTLERLREVATALIARLGTPEPPRERGLAWCHHHMGTCRMGDDVRTSVVDRTLRVHGVSNLYIAGSAPFVTAGAGGPTLLMAALSLRLADHLREAAGVRPAARRAR